MSGDIETPKIIFFWTHKIPGQNAWISAEFWNDILTF